MIITNELILAIMNMPGMGNEHTNLIVDYLQEHDEVTLEELHENIREYNARHSRIHVPDYSSFLSRIEAAKEMLEKQEEQGLVAISKWDERYPDFMDVLGNNKPPIIYAKDDMLILYDQNHIAVIGNRKPTAHGANMANSSSLLDEVKDLFGSLKEDDYYIDFYE